MATKKNNKALPSKEAALFRSILKFYERKQYKKGLKAAEQILSKFPEHGETLAMKGLTLNCMDKKTEAYELVKKGIKFDITSHVCWHVLGLLYRSDRDYVEASKCYNTALKHDKENIQILRDLSLLQIQLRDLEGYRDTRQTLVRLKPKQKNNWIAYAIAAHLVRDYSGSQAALDLEEKPEQVEYEYSEILLYRNMIIEESGQFQDALKHLDESKPMIVDLLACQEKRADLLLKLERWEEAKAEYHSLLEINSENYDYLNGYLRAHSLPSFISLPRPSATPSRSLVPDSFDESHEKFGVLESVLNALSTEFPSSHTIRELPLRFYSGDRFRKAMDKYLRRGFLKGTPALFTASKWLYTSPAKVAIIEELLLSFVHSLEENHSFPDTAEKSAPSVLVWTIYYLAQHYDVQGDLKKAFEYIDRAIQHTPTVIDLYCTKARFYKHAGDVKAASDVYEKARELDLADRYLNTKSTKYCIRADQVEKADSVISLFTRDGDNSQTNLFDMQCMWYEREVADSFTRTGDYGKALKKYKAMLTHFADISEDQFDFHTYCLRKMTLRAYVKLLRFEDQLLAHRNHLAAVRGIVDIYLILNAKPKEQPKEDTDPSLANLSVQERKKLESKKRRAEARAKQKQAEEQAKNQQAQKEKQKPKNPQEDDINGEKLVNVGDKLAEASKYLQSVRGYANNDMETQFLAFQLFMIRKKYLLALQALKTSIHLDANHAQTHKNRIQFLREVDPATEKEAIVAEVLKEEKQALLGSHSSLQELNSAYLSANKHSVPSTLAAAEVTFSLDPAHKSEALKIIESIPQLPDLHKNLQDCIAVHKSVSSTFSEPEVAQKLYAQFQPLFPWSTYFHPQSNETKPPLEEQKPEAPSQP